KVVDVILARGVRSLRDGDTLAGGGPAAATYSKLGDDPTVGKLVIDHNRVSVVIEAATGVSRKCLKQIVDRSGARQPRARFVVDGEDGVNHLHILAWADGAIGIRWSTDTTSGRSTGID